MRLAVVLLGILGMFSDGAEAIQTCRENVAKVRSIFFGAEHVSIFYPPVKDGCFLQRSNRQPVSLRVFSNINDR